MFESDGLKFSPAASDVRMLIRTKHKLIIKLIREMNLLSLINLSLARFAVAPYCQIMD